MNEQKKRKSKGIGARLLLAAALWALLTGCGRTAPVQTEAEPPVQTEPAGEVSVREELDISLGQGLKVLRMDRYSGIYMEDGTNDIVTDVMMLVLENTAGEDLQLARIDVVCGEQTLWFEVTNLPAGEKAVLLEKERRPLPAEEPAAVSARNVVFFEEPMALPEGLVTEGSEGLLRLTNGTGGDLPGPAAVFYKYRSGDLYYGGITFRVTLEEGLAAGETYTVPAGHYDPEQSRVVDVQCGG